MKTRPFAAAFAALALTACGQPAEAPKAEAPPPPQSPMDQVLSMAPEQQPVFAFQQLAAYQQAHPESQPPCAAVRGSEAKGVIPANVAPDSIYAAHAGAAVYSVQCGALISATRFEPREHWLVVFAPGATEAVIVNCADAQGREQCPRVVPTIAATATP
jgi:hypothetical protein